MRNNACLFRSGERVDYHVRLTTTRPRFGGLRWWFLCPLLVQGWPCNRRVGKLYLPPGGRYYGCRHCYDLTYRRVQEHDKRVDFLRKHPEVLRRLIEAPDAKGNGGVVVQMPNGQLFNTISNGYNTMMGYAAQIPHLDRWAIVAYVRALQRAQNASQGDVPADLQGSIR